MVLKVKLYLASRLTKSILFVQFLQYNRGARRDCFCDSPSVIACRKDGIIFVDLHLHSCSVNIELITINMSLIARLYTDRHSMLINLTTLMLQKVQYCFVNLQGNNISFLSRLCTNDDSLSEIAPSIELASYLVIHTFVI